MGFLIVDGRKVPVDETVLDHLLAPLGSDEEVRATQLLTAAGRLPAGQPPTATIPVAKAKASVLPASRSNRITRPKARQLIAEGDHVAPPCTWCGLPTGCFCDQCMKPVCSVCDQALGQCVECCCRNMGCTEGQARQHAALVLKEVPADSASGGISRSGFGHNVDPAFLALPFEQQAEIFLDGGVPVNPDAQLRQRRRPEPMQPSRPRQETADEAARWQEAMHRQRAETVAQREEERRLAGLKAEEEAKMQEHIARQNALAGTERKERRRGAGAAPSRDAGGEGHGYVGPGGEMANLAGSEEGTGSKARMRRLRQRANREAAAEKKKEQAAQMAKEQFLRDTAQRFTERQSPLEPTEPQKSKEPKVRAPKELAENKIAEDLLIGLWEAKLTSASASSGST
ncbi:unnamed protein product [Symbiodinium sp. CCMP2592]|nr:unnamed protein product [Symbiodinium sp. CCMP2592]